MLIFAKYADLISKFKLQQINSTEFFEGVHSLDDQLTVTVYEQTVKLSLSRQQSYETNLCFTCSLNGEPLESLLFITPDFNGHIFITPSQIDGKAPSTITLVFCAYLQDVLLEQFN